jgi:hypothetical protein
MQKRIGTILIFIAVAVTAMATPPPTTPEIDPGTAGSALALLAGSALVIRGRRTQ